jgi:hypothetical protein
MEISTKHYGRNSNAASKIIEVQIKSYGTTLSEDITNINGVIDTSFIESLRQIADELEEQNTIINNSK